MTQSNEVQAPKSALEIMNERFNETKRLAQKLSRVDVKAAESEAEVEACNDTMRKMMDGDIPQTGANNIAVVAREQQKFLKRSEKVRGDAVVDAQALAAMQEALAADIEALVAPYRGKFEATEEVAEEVTAELDADADDIADEDE